MAMPVSTPPISSVLPDDAIPVLVGALPALPATEREAVLPILRERQAELATDPAFSGAVAWNLGRERARQALADPALSAASTPRTACDRASRYG